MLKKNLTKENSPLVSVGMPVFNNKFTISDAIETILGQTTTDIELIISDNASTDGTAEICRVYAGKDNRIRLIEQKVNIGSDKNFEIVFKESRGEFYMWAPGHYSRSLNFIESNLKALHGNSLCAFSSSPNFFAGEESYPEKQFLFNLEGELFERISMFLDNCWVSHACYYALFRRSYLEDYTNISESFLANDWAIVMHLLIKGEFSRSTDSLLIVRRGASVGTHFLASFRTRKIHYIFPLYEFSKRFVKLVMEAKELSVWQRVVLISRVLWLNISIPLWQIMPKKDGVVNSIFGFLLPSKISLKTEKLLKNIALLLGVLGAVAIIFDWHPLTMFLSFPFFLIWIYCTWLLKEPQLKWVNLVVLFIYFYGIGRYFSAF